MIDGSAAPADSNDSGTADLPLASDGSEQSPISPAHASASPAAAAPPLAAANLETTSKTNGGFGKRTKAMRKAMVKDRSNQVCVLFVGRGSCRFGDKCNRSHDLAKWMAEHRRDDAPGSCPLFEAYGFCRFGLTCRWGRGHVEDDGVTNKNLAAQVDAFPDECNEVPLKVFHALRRRKLDLRRAKAAQAEVKAAAAAAETGPGEFDFPAARAKVTGLPFDDVRKRIDFSNKLYLAPLTTVGNLPFRKVAVDMGADVTCGEMAIASSLLQGRRTEWSLLRRHKAESIFGVQIASGYVDQFAKVCTAMRAAELNVDFVDINACCPLDMVVNKVMGSGLLARRKRIISLARVGATMLDVPLTFKLRLGMDEPMVHTLLPELAAAGVAAVSIHGRTRAQRYTQQASWDYMIETAKAADLPVIGNGDLYSYEELDAYMNQPGLTSVMVGRGALIKPWIFTELKERRHWDISSSERFDILRSFANEGLKHWGSDSQGVETTRRYMLEWLSFLYRYVPVGCLEVLPQHMALRPPAFVGRNELETLLASDNAADWVRITEMLLGPAPASFTFVPKHKSNAWSTTANA
ncbi:uncharacterized protein AMSG_01934 [Thecamonas trahens ATCC 50062]|uniref:tRNA-dihydrouridine(47) synthase [NAD(P)(+)] n=1 Tax=Thecamonas trahens ATCC 50062 TaxID=461836 RepID=A0A0L0DVX0_THETB|nr:hypothetical protein AMSG_01934 [Thecamonas trahens ATCC 50062]KNC55663.1 hypothetical protein AMSG_01934 [Thecamonas trahens ATCC 50062]|eukprot:XP_013761432.1 hypothetical protein AMSG_01934 [Thecamonas trahens ATCC 50062]